MADPRLTFLIDAKNMASKEFAGVKQQLGGKAGLVAVAGAAALAMGAVVKGISDAVDAALAEEKSIARLDAALEANVDSWSGNRDAIESVIKEREKLAFADDEQRASLALLVTATKDVTKAQELQATAMDLARLKNISLEEASTALIKVEGGQYKLLKQLGIQLREGASSTEALAAVQKVAAGQAEKYGNTTSGALESLDIVVGDLVEDFGSMFLPIIKDLAIFARDTLIPAIQDVAGVIGDVLGVIGGVIDVAADLFDPLVQDASRAIDTLKGVHDALFDIEIEGQRLGDVLGQLWTVGWEELTGASEKAAAEVTLNVEKIRGSIDWGSMAGEVKEGAEEVAKQLPKAIRQSRAEIEEASRQNIAAYAQTLRGGWDSVQSAWQSLKEAMKDPLSGAKRIAELEGILASQKLAQGLRSNDPLIRADAAALKAQVEGELAKLKKDAFTFGKDSAMQYAAGIRAATGNVISAALALSQKVANILELHSPAKEGPLSRGGGPEGWGARMARLWAEGISSQVGTAHAALTGLASVPMAGLTPAGAVGNSAFGLAGGAAMSPTVIRVPVYLNGHEIAEAVGEVDYYARAAAPR